MTWLLAIFLGLVQGLAEFLPISSSGHLSIFQNIFGMTNVEESNLFFDVVLHLGTLAAVIAVYYKDVLEIIRSFFSLFTKKGRSEAAENRSGLRLLLMMFISTLPLALILPVKKYVETLSGNTCFIGFALVVTGSMLYIADKLVSGRKNEKTMTVKDALAVGLAQMLAVVPGLSRSGFTITGGLFSGFDRKFAVKYSFLISIPAVLGANFISLIDAVKAGIDTSLIPMYIVGVIVAGVSGYFAIKLVNKLIESSKFGKFAYYCWGVGALAIILSFIF